MGNRSIKVSIQLTHVNAIEILAGKVPYPKSLVKFLDGNLSTQNNLLKVVSLTKK